MMGLCTLRGVKCLLLLRTKDEMGESSRKEESKLEHKTLETELEWTEGQ